MSNSIMFPDPNVPAKGFRATCIQKIFDEETATNMPTFYCPIGGKELGIVLGSNSRIMYVWIETRSLLFSFNKWRAVD